MKRRANFATYAKHAIAFGVMFVLSSAQIDAQISPFAMAFLFACIFLPINTWAMCAAFFFSQLYFDGTQEGAISSLFAIAVFVGLHFGIKRYSWKFPKIKNVTTAVVGFIIANGYAIAMAFGDNESFYKSLITVIIGSVFLVCLVVLIDTIKQKRAKIPWTVDQKICLSVAVVIFALGLSGLDSDYFSVHKFISIFIILVGVFMFGNDEAHARSTLIVAVCLGLGASFAELNLNYVAIYTLLCAVTIAFKTKTAGYSIVALVFTDVVLGTYFNAYRVYDFYALLPLLLAVCAFVAVPNNLVDKLGLRGASLSGHLTAKNTINKNRAGVYTRINSLANVFGELQNIYRSLVHAAAPIDETKQIIASQVRGQVCENCPNRAKCLQEVGAENEIAQHFIKVAYIGLSRGQVGFLDIPQGLAIKCTRINNVLSVANRLLKERMERETTAVKLDTGKILMAQLLSGLNKLMKQFAEDVCSAVVFDNDLVDLIKDELLYKNIVASDCIITRTATNQYSISTLVRREDSKNRVIEQVISRVVKHKVQLDSVDDGETAGFAIVTVKTAPQYQILFGVSQVSKNFSEPCGDIYSFLKVSNEKTLMAVCDGMGAGRDAEKAATLALSLVENFYKAGFPNEMIMTSVNQLLQISSGEVFSALDICIFNMSTGEVDFIKVGASDGFIKRGQTVEVVEAGSLPIGILEEMQPKITRAVLCEKDMVVLCSDGVVDSFIDRLSLANFINNLSHENPQELADTILKESLNRSGRIANDDSTVVVGKLMRR